MKIILVKTKEIANRYQLKQLDSYKTTNPDYLGYCEAEQAQVWVKSTLTKDIEVITPQEDTFFKLAVGTYKDCKILKAYENVKDGVTQKILEIQVPNVKELVYKVYKVGGSKYPETEVANIERINELLTGFNLTKFEDLKDKVVTIKAGNKMVNNKEIYIVSVYKPFPPEAKLDEGSYKIHDLVWTDSGKYHKFVSSILILGKVITQTSLIEKSDKPNSFKGVETPSNNARATKIIETFMSGKTLYLKVNEKGYGHIVFSIK